ncbi:MAG: hypothetical protein M1815_006338 [Lichina confinis]|nr:MAG: hypothetical protein M1815_006338 [Lichina confinis]
MTLVRKIRALDVPIIVLSATLTPSLVPEFLTAIDMIGPTTIRSGADGPNLQYSNWRTICYVQRVKDCEQLAELLQCPFYHGQMEPSARAGAMKIWLSGAAKVIVGTLAFGAGVDNPHVRQKLFVLREYTHGHDQYITSIQVNSSTAKTHVQGTAGETQQDGNDDPLQFSVSFSYSILRPTTSAGHFIPVPDP